MRIHSTPKALAVPVAVAAVVTAVVIANPTVATAAYPSDNAISNGRIVAIDSGFYGYWTPDGYVASTDPTKAPTTANDLHGTVLDTATLQYNDKLTSWINQNATKAQQFKALQDAEYQNSTNTAFDQSYTVSQGLGSLLEQYYVEGRQSGALPLTSALINSSTGTTGAYIGSSAAKAAFSYARPYVVRDPNATVANLPATDDQVGCDPQPHPDRAGAGKGDPFPKGVNGSSQQPISQGTAWADAQGNLKITRVPDTTDTTGEFNPNNKAVTLTGGYGQAGICQGGGYPSGHTLTAYQAGITLAALVPELAPEVLARASEAGNDRIVLGVHYPLDIMGSRSLGEAALASRMGDSAFVTSVFTPAQQELRSYLEQRCGTTIANCIAKESRYTNDPYAGASIPNGTSQIVTDRVSAVKVYTERMTYGFPQNPAKAGQAAAVPTGASNLLLTVFPTLTDAQRTSVLAQTEIASGYPLDQTGTTEGSWQRINLAAATSSTVQVQADGSVTVVSTGGQATVVPAAGGTTTPLPTTGGGSAPHLPVVSG